MFCEWQLYAKGTFQEAYTCSEEDPEAQLFCGAHLAESRAFPCPYNSEQIYDLDGRKTIAHKNNEGLVGVCEDFKPLAQSSPLCKDNMASITDCPISEVKHDWEIGF